MSLAAYAKKRNFSRTPEPPARKARTGKQPRFVIQKHAASRLHYDFRLELGGTLKSWAVPKGIPLKRGEKRLAVHVEDHPVSYIDFEGTIPQGQYGGGTVMVWDQGTYHAEAAKPAEELAGGKLHFTLRGKKVHGSWYLVRTRSAEDNQWLLIRGGDDHKPISIKQDDTSVVSGKSMKAITASEPSGKSAPTNKTRPSKTTAKAGKNLPAGRMRAASSTAESATRPSVLKFLEPMKARLVEAPPTGDWAYEIKFDGFRAIGLKESGGVRLLSRNNKDLAGKFPEVAEAVASLDARDAIVDGEIVALDDKGRSSFQLLQAFEVGDLRPAIHYYVFDLLHHDGVGLVGRPLEERKRRLKTLVARKADGIVRFSASLTGDAKALLERAAGMGLEGLIGKRAGSIYETGGRSGAWIKLKVHQEQEFVIGGYTPPAGSRPLFGALIVGVYEGRRLLFTGKVGTGFSHESLRRLHARLQPLRQDRCPFVNLPEPRPSRYGQGLTAAVMKRCHWVKPTLVCQLKFSEWTRDGSLRHPVFLGLREDKSATKVVREKPVSF